MSKTVFGLMPMAVKKVAWRSVIETGFSIAMQGRSSAVFPYTHPRFMPPPKSTTVEPAVKWRCWP